MNRGTIVLALLGAALAHAESAQRVVTMVQYVATDYRLAVPDAGVIAIAFEYEENLQTAREASSLYARLAPDGGCTQSMKKLEALVEAKAPPEEVESLATTLATTLRQELKLSPAPEFWPDLQMGARLFSDNCARCHGATGKGDGAAASALKPPPANMTSPAWADARSPFQIFNTTTVGISGTGMPPFADKLDDKSRWAVAFFVLTLRQPNNAGVAHPWIGMTELSSSSNLQLATRFGIAIEAADAARRAEPRPFTVSQAMKKMIEAINSAQMLVEANRRNEASDVVAAAYLDVVEPVESTLGVTSMASMTRMEQRITELRQAISGAGPVTQEAETAIQQLEAIAARHPDPGDAPLKKKLPSWVTVATPSLLLLAVLLFVRYLRRRATPPSSS